MGQYDMLLLLEYSAHQRALNTNVQYYTSQVFSHVTIRSSGRLMAFSLLGLKVQNAVRNRLKPTEATA